MKIALLAPLWKKVPPEKYGGSELVVFNLAKGLTALGHKVTTFACGGSRVEGRLIAVIEKPLYELVGGFNWSKIQPHEFLSFLELGKRFREFDIVHNHMGLHPIALSPFLSVPMVTTLHSSLSPDFPCLVKAFRKFPFISISNAQRKLTPELNYVATVYHGIDIQAFKPSYENKNKNYFVFLGTLSRNKGVDIAVSVARKLGVRLTIAGEVRAEDKLFLEKKVFPYVDGKRIRFVGEIGHAQKVKLLAGASALFFPSRWNEAFGLVMIEALACGTPVIALRSGAVPEVIIDGKTGIIAENEKQFTKAVKEITRISRRTCRKEAEERFDISVMAKNYEKAYQSLIRKRKK